MLRKQSSSGKGPDDRNSSTMVSSSDVKGTQVFSRNGDLLGQIDHLMIDKASGQVAYAVMSFGGFLGFGTGTYPLPWKKLGFDSSIGGFVTDVTHRQLTPAPALTEAWFDDVDYARRSYQHFGVAPYWR